MARFIRREIKKITIAITREMLMLLLIGSLCIAMSKTACQIYAWIWHLIKKPRLCFKITNLFQSILWREIICIFFLIAALVVFFGKMSGFKFSFSVNTEIDQVPQAEGGKDTKGDFNKFCSQNLFSPGYLIKLSFIQASI